MEHLIEASSEIVSKGSKQISEVEERFLVANIARIRKMCEEELTGGYNPMPSSDNDSDMD